MKQLVIMVILLSLFVACQSDNNNNSKQNSESIEKDEEVLMTANEENNNIFNEKCKELDTMRDSTIAMEDIIKKQHDTIIDYLAQIQTLRTELK